jgi:hypothetical protein
MRVGRRFWLAAALALGSIGCRAAGTGTLSLHPRPVVQPGSLDVNAFIAEHNRNAERIQSLEARPSIRVADRRRLIPMDGKMALERPRNFRLELSSLNNPKADIGSNDDEFWFWVSNSDDPSIYWCKYSELKSSALAASYQPDWIIEAMGLKPISPEEKDDIRVQKGPEPGTTALVFPPTRNRKENYTRVLIVSNRERRIKQLRLHAAAEPKTLIAQAEPSQYKEYPAKSDTPDSTAEMCYLPEKLVLDWKRDQLKLDVTLKEVTLNQFDPARRSAMFVEPEREGYQRKNLAEVGRQTRPRTSTRQTMPPPADGIKLGHPAPLSNDDLVVPNVGQARSRQRSSPSPESLVPPVQQVVGAPLPTPPVSPGAQAATADTGSPYGFTIER